jgi:hypothetical protein
VNAASAHPSYGAHVFGFRVPLRTRVGDALVFVGLLAMLGGTAACLAVGKREGGEVLGGAGWGLGLAIALLGTKLRKGEGTPFDAYENGIVAGATSVAWDDITELTAATIAGRHVVMLRGAPATRLLRMSSWDDGAGRFVDWVREHVIAAAAREKLSQLARGETVRIGSVALTRDKISIGPNGMLWKDYDGVRLNQAVESGSLTQTVLIAGKSGVLRLGILAPSAALLLALLTEVDARRARGDAAP